MAVNVMPTIRTRLHLALDLPTTEEFPVANSNITFWLNEAISNIVALVWDKNPQDIMKFCATTSVINSTTTTDGYFLEVPSGSQIFDVKVQYDEEGPWVKAKKAQYKEYGLNLIYGVDANSIYRATKNIPTWTTSTDDNGNIGIIYRPNSPLPYRVDVTWCSFLRTSTPNDYFAPLTNDGWEADIDDKSVPYFDMRYFPPALEDVADRILGHMLRAKIAELPTKAQEGNIQEEYAAGWAAVKHYIEEEEDVELANATMSKLGAEQQQWLLEFQDLQRRKGAALQRKFGALQVLGLMEVQPNA